MRPILLVGGAPRLSVDAVRYLSVRASGRSALALHRSLATVGVSSDLLLGQDCSSAGVSAVRYLDRAGLDDALRAWIADHRDGVVVMSAAVNDYQIDRVDSVRGGLTTTYAPGTKIPSGADELVIRLRPAGKLIDVLRGWGLVGPIVGFKYEDRTTVLASADALRLRTGAALVVANSLCGSVQALVDGDGVELAADRDDLLTRLAARLVRLAQL